MLFLIHSSLKNSHRFFSYAAWQTTVLGLKIGTSSSSWLKRCFVNSLIPGSLEPGDRSIQLSGGYTLEPVGNAISAEHFMVMEEGSGVLGIMAQGRLAALFVPLETAQEIADLPGMVNEGLMPGALGKMLESAQ